MVQVQGRIITLPTSKDIAKAIKTNSFDDLEKVIRMKSRLQDGDLEFSLTLWKDILKMFENDIWGIDDYKDFLCVERIVGKKQLKYLKETFDLLLQLTKKQQMIEAEELIGLSNGTLRVSDQAQKHTNALAFIVAGDLVNDMMAKTKVVAQSFIASDDIGNLEITLEMLQEAVKNNGELAVLLLEDFDQTFSYVRDAICYQDIFEKYRGDYLSEIIRILSKKLETMKFKEMQKLDGVASFNFHSKIEKRF